MKFDHIVDSIVNKVNSRLKFLYRNAKCLDMNTRLTLCTALIQCHFDYASSAWFSSISKTMLKKLQICQNKVVRFILNMEPRTSITQEILDKVKMLKVPDRVSQLRLNHVFNIANDLAPKYLSQNKTLLLIRVEQEVQPIEILLFQVGQNVAIIVLYILL